MEYGGLDLSPGSSALVLLDAVGQVAHFKHFDYEDSKLSFTARHSMACEVIDSLTSRPVLLGLEDYALGPGQHVSYQIAEVAGIVKAYLFESKYPFCLIHPRKRQSYVARRKNVSKNDVIAWGIEHGFSPPVKTRSNPGYNKRQREDLADAFVMACMARDLATMLAEQMPPRKGDIFLDPDTGIAFKKGTLYHVDKAYA